MPLLTAQDPLPGCPRRIVVAGVSGSGKTTLAASVSERLAVPTVDIDILFQNRGWSLRPASDEDVRPSEAEPAWVTEWQFSLARALVAAHADLLVWLDLPRWQVMGQVTRRSVSRALGREAPGPSKVGPPGWAQIPDRAHLMRWAQSTHHKSAERVTALRQRRPDLTVVRLPSRLAVQHWVAGPLQDAADRCGEA